MPVYVQWNIDLNSSNGPRLPQTRAASFLQLDPKRLAPALSHASAFSAGSLPIESYVRTGAIGSAQTHVVCSQFWMVINVPA
jgi:hypothetical protein